jgi:hypothetical protein
MKLRRFWTFAVLAWITGCKTTPNPPGLEDDYRGTPMTCTDHDGDGYGLGCALGNDCNDTNAAITNECYVCAHDQPGCPCTSDGAQTGCGKVTARIGDQTTCGYGVSVCSSGKWGECVLDGQSTRSFTSSRGSLGLAPSTPCNGNVCDPYCKQYPDTPDETLTTHTGIVGTDGGVTLERVDGSWVTSDGGMPNSIKTQLVEAGLYPDAPPDAIVYHELAPPTTAQDDVAATMNVKSLDVYFMNYSAGDATPAHRALWYDLDSPGSVIEQVRRAVKDSWFGIGRYEQYDHSAWKGDSYHTVVYDHVQSMTPDLAKVTEAINWVDGHFHDVNSVAPQSWVDALFATATTGGLRGEGSAFWTSPRDQWISVESGESGPCPSGGIGYPCFRPGSVPITVLFAQAPSNNGPSGQYAYARSAPYAISGAKSWPSTPLAVTGNHTETTARALDPIGQYASYAGDTSPAMANQSWHHPASDGCTNGSGSQAPNVFFKFHASERTWFHFDTVGSSFDTVLYMYTAADMPVVCNNRHFFSATPNPMPASIDGVVDPGDYFVVVDGADSNAHGNYVLRVNAMPDGTDAGPVAEPNYDEAVAAFNAIGAKLVTVDTSGYTCDKGPTSFVQRNTGNQLERVAMDTGSVDTTGMPNRVRVDPNDGICHANDAPIEDQLAGAILRAYGAVNADVADLSAVAVDNDDAIDFDGPPGRSPMLTSVNIDDATFVQSITAVATPSTTANCQAMLTDRFVACRPGTSATFRVTFKTPPTVPLLSHQQIFTLAIRVLRNDSIVLGETPVVLVVPPYASAKYTDAWFIRDYDTVDACPKGTAPLWSFFAWKARTPGDSHIEFEVAVAPSVGELAAAPRDALLFSDPPGPASLALQPIGAQDSLAGFDTQRGGTLVDATLAADLRPRDSKAMRLRAHLVPSTDGTAAPFLQLWNQQISCQPAE